MEHCDVDTSRPRTEALISAETTALILGATGGIDSAEIAIRFSFRRPRGNTSAMVRQVSNMSRPRCRDSSLDRCVRLLACLDAVEEVPHVRRCPVFEAFFLQYGIAIGLHILVKNTHSRTVDLQRRLRAPELKPSIVDRRAHHAFVNYIKPRIAEGGLDGVRALPFGEYVFVAQHQRHRWLVCFHRPLRDVDPVCEQVRHRTAAEAPEPPPAVVLLRGER